ncbi:hypothetical protein AB835_13730 [Candidatus Endobugula sertula]|uniref:Uncharacterized protein n=1 Tax=Candidatus Endobugula sertula TaxID=62101 RepID=A0A1D2QLR4_9GAMM|nr:hypothetical protein AB835_13730 [Candidatus Endobugula sertula]
MNFHHIGLACFDLVKTLENMQFVYDIISVSPIVEDPLQKVSVCLVKIANLPMVELVMGKPVESFLSQGNAIYHMCYECDDIEQQIKIHKNAGDIVIQKPTPAVLFEGRRVAFLKTQLGIIELLEKYTPDHVTIHNEQDTKEEKDPLIANFTVLSTFSASPLLPILTYMADMLRLVISPHIVAHDQITSHLLSQSLQSNNNDQIVLLRLEDWDTNFDNDAASLSKTLHGQITSLYQATLTWVQNNHSTCIIIFCPSTPEFINDKLSAELYHELKQYLSSALNNSKVIQFIDFEEKVLLREIGNIFDLFMDRKARVPYTLLGQFYLSELILRTLHFIKRRPYKVLVIDCDNTLWEGVCSEDGIENILFTENKILLQKFIKLLSNNGFLICLCSKNNKDDVLKVFNEHKGMELMLDDISTYRINWNKKSINIKEISEEVGLSTDSFIFIDDNPIECAEVKQNCPEVTVIRLPEDDKIPEILYAHWALDNVASTEEDHQRKKFYQLEKKRKALLEKKTNFFI